MAIPGSPADAAPPPLHDTLYRRRFTSIRHSGGVSVDHTENGVDRQRYHHWDPGTEQGTESAITAVHRIRYRPAMRNGQPVGVRLNIELSFALY